MPYRQREIVLLPVPFTDLSEAKHRPALVLSNSTHNRSSPDVVVAAITSSGRPSRYRLRITSGDLDGGTLPRDSFVCIDKLYTILAEKVIRQYAVLTATAYERVTEAIGRLIQPG
jgi:mRNA interferase MazF